MSASLGCMRRSVSYCIASISYCVSESGLC